MPVGKKASKKAVKSIGLKKKGLKKTTLSTDTKVIKKPGKKVLKPSQKNARARRSPSMSINFGEGTDMKVAFEEALRGGSSRSDVTNRLAEMWKDHKTRSGKDKPVSTVINHVVRRARENGYEIQQTWKLVKVDDSSAAEQTQLPGTRKIARKTIRKPGAVKPVKAVKKAVKRRS
jgi:hypothetical protein